MTRAQRKAPATPLHDSLREYGRGIAGGLLFSIPLLYTMELWEGGLSVPSARQLLLVAVTFLLLLGYNRFAGLHHDSSWTEVVIDSVEELGIGVFVSAGVLYLIGQVTLEHSVQENLGIIVVEAMVVAVGVSVGTAQLGGSSEEDETGLKGGSRKAGSVDGDPRGFAGEIVIALCGAVLFAANVAPTEEIQMIAAGTSVMRLLILMLASLLLGGGILFYSHFLGTTRRRHTVGWMDALRGSITTYAIALIAAGLFLWYFGRFAGESRSSMAAQIVVLGLPAVIGASAGKLLLQSGDSR